MEQEQVKVIRTIDQLEQERQELERIKDIELKARGFSEAQIRMIKSCDELDKISFVAGAERIIT